MYSYFNILYFYLIVFCPGLFGDIINEIPVESDDDRLNQALLLVDILKTEYLKLLREGLEEPENVTTAVEQSTCASTTDGSSVNDTLSSTGKYNETLAPEPKTEHEVSTISQSESNSLPGVLHPAAVPAQPLHPRPWPGLVTTDARRFYGPLSHQALPPLPLERDLYAFPRRYFRRTFPDYFYYYGSYRRMNDYYDETPKETVKAPRTVKPTRITATEFKRTTRIKPIAYNAHPDRVGNRRRFNNRPPQPQRPKTKIGRKSGDENTTSTVSTDASDTKASTSTNDTSTTTSLPSITSSAASITKTKGPITRQPIVPTTTLTTEKWPAFQFKPTLRVFLENSSPLPIPLPENNAFCFTNPTNAMCRSP